MGWQDRDYGNDDQHRKMVRPKLPATLTGWVMGLCVVGFFVSIASPKVVEAGVMAAGSVVPGAQVWRLATHPWIYGRSGEALGLVLDLLLNLAMLWIFGRLAETMLPRGRWIAVAAGGILVSALGMELAWRLVPTGFALGFIHGPLVIVFALMGAGLAKAPRQPFGLFFLPMSIELRWIVLFFAGLSALLVVSRGPAGAGEMAHLLALGAGFAIAKLRLPARQFTFNRLVEDIRDRNQAQTLAGHHEEVDRILSKIKREGMGKLTEAEKRTLKRDTDRLRK